MGFDTMELDVSSDYERNSTWSANHSFQDHVSEDRLHHDSHTKTSCNVHTKDPKECCLAPWTCSKNAQRSWTICNPGFIKSGTYGQVWAVCRGGQRSALKMPNDATDDAHCLDIATEVHKLQQLSKAMSGIKEDSKQCQASIMTLIDQMPCRVRSSGQIAPASASYVMDLMDGDLSGYQSKFGSKCFQSIAQKAMQAIHCFHLAGWVHSDVKELNFLWRGVDDSGCPQEVRLADYGISGEIGGTNDLFDGYYDDTNQTFLGNYLVSDVFIRPNRFVQQSTTWKLNLKRDGSKYEYHPAIDWCSYHFMFPGIKGKYWSGDCGMMGTGRAQHVFVEKEEEGEKEEED